jgi:hypothetical protein
MKWSAVGLSLGLTLGLVGAAQAKTASIDFTGDQPVVQGLKLVNNSAGSDGVITIVKKGGKNVAATGGTDAARYLYLALDPAFKEGLKSVFVDVEYFDEGKGGFKLQYDGGDDAYQTANFPPTGLTFDTMQFTHQSWHLSNFKLKGSMTGGADIRIDDRKEDDADGPQFISKITVSDEDTNFTHFPYAVNKITVDGKVGAGEWDGAYAVKIGRAEQDAIRGAPNWAGPDEFNGTYSFKWDENAMYILAQVHDITPRMNDQTPPNLYNGDGFELSFGTDDTDVERTAYADTDFKFILSAGAKPLWQVLNMGEEKDLGDPGPNIVITNTSDGYLLEAQIPWTVMNNAKVTQGQRVAWSMFANNAHSTPSSQEVAMNPFGRTGISYNPAGWTRAVLDPKPAQ